MKLGASFREEFVEAALGFLCGMCLDTKWTQCPWKSQRSPTHRNGKGKQIHVDELGLTDFVPSSSSVLRNLG